MTQLILMRHGQSQWNLLNLFTGWVDIPLSTTGVEEALIGGRLIQNEPIDIIFTSTLIRAQMTAALVMSVHHSGKVPVMLHPGEGHLDEWGHIHSEEAKGRTVPMIKAWELNERMYGELQGVNKKELADRYGREQVHMWRRSFDIAPPGGESLKMTAARTIPYFKEQIIPCLEKGQNAFISAHGNSLRSIIMEIDRLSPEEVVNLELATGAPIIYSFESGQLTRNRPLMK